MTRSLKIAWGTLAVSIAVLGLKTAAYWLTGSVALFSDALETIINVAAAIGALFALWISGKPADYNHPYGHYKAEYLSAVMEASLVLFTAALIGLEAWKGWWHPHVPHMPFRGIALNAFAGVINLYWALRLIRQGSAWKSPALVAGGRHIMTDVWTTGAVLVGFGLVPVTGWLRLDALVAAFVAGNILWTGYGMLRASVGGLMDEVTDPQIVTELGQIIAHNSAGAIEAHDLRTRVAGSMTFVEFHLVVPGNMTVNDSHAICDKIEKALLDKLDEAVIHIHVEPEQKAKHDALEPEA